MKKGKLKLAFAAAVAAISLTACASAPSTVNTSAISYDQDTRTGLCFAEKTSNTSMDHKVTSITNVECSDEVVKLLPTKAGVANGAIYGKDPRTKDCFAQVAQYTRNDYYVSSIAAVPCTPKVVDLIFANS